MILKVIDRKPGGNELHYGNVLANTSTSRWITGTSEEDAKSRTAGGYTIDRDIDEYTSEKWSKIIGKETFTPSEVIDNILEHQEYVRKDVRQRINRYQSPLTSSFENIYIYIKFASPKSSHPGPRRGTPLPCGLVVWWCGMRKRVSIEKHYISLDFMKILKLETKEVWINAELRMTAGLGR